MYLQASDELLKDPCSIQCTHTTPTCLTPQCTLGIQYRNSETLTYYSLSDNNCAIQTYRHSYKKATVFFKRFVLHSTRPSRYWLTSRLVYHLPSGPSFPSHTRLAAVACLSLKTFNKDNHVIYVLHLAKIYHLYIINNI